MSLNSEIKFSEIPNIEKQRSTFDRSFSHKTTMNSSDIVPLMWSECLPGDTIQIDFSHVTRMTTPIAPVIDNAWLDIMAFFVPTRLLWTHWKEFWGENNTTYWEQPVRYTTPKLDFAANASMASNGVAAGSLINYLGVPVGYKESANWKQKLNAFPLRAYCKIVNDWYRDENLKQPIVENTGDSATQVVRALGNYVEAYSYQAVSQGAYCAKAAKAHDYFTSCLPAPMKGQQLSLFGNNGLFPVQSYWAGNADDGYTPYKADGVGKEASRVDQAVISPTRVLHPSADMTTWDIGGETLANNAFKSLLVENDTSTNTKGIKTVYNTTQNPSGTMSEALTIQNLWANMNSAAISTISQLRTAFAIQRFYEAQARGGSRYCEFLNNIFGITNQDARLQRSEFLGAKRFPINVDQVLQTSGTGASGTSTPQGNTAAYSCTVNSDDLCTYSTQEHGIIMVMGVIRQEHSYAQGISKEWLRDQWSDYYIPQFAHLSEMPVYECEIYAQGTSDDQEVFGYQEAWSEYRYKPNMITGKLSPQMTGNLALWHYGDYYTAKPTLSAEWINETPDNIARTLAVQNEPQFIMDAYFSMKWTRVMPLYSVPGLIDHF